MTAKPATEQPKAASEHLSSENARLREALELIEVDLEAGDVPAKVRVKHALSRTKAWLAALSERTE